MNAPRAPAGRSGPARLLLVDRRAIARLRAMAPGTPRYRILGRLASDGAGEQLRVLDLALERELVMTVVDGASPRRRIDEACITASLDHPGIPAVHEFSVGSDGRYFVTMGPQEGAPFADVIDDAAKRGGRWSRTRALEILLRACDTLAYAHSRGVAHGNVAPTDIVVGEFGETSITRWDEARLVRSPGQDGAGHASFREDALAMGRILRRLLDAQGVAAAELDAIAAKATAPDPAARYADLRALADDLRAYLENRVVAAHRTGALAELRKWLARNRGGATAAIAALLVALGGLLALDVVARVKNGELRVARDEARRHVEEVGRLASLKRVRDLVERAGRLWPAVEAQVGAMSAWLAEARELLDERDAHAATAAALLARRMEGSDERVPRFADPIDAWWHESLARLRRALDLLAEKAPFRVGTVAEMERRRERALTIAARSIGAHADEWNDAIASIAGDPRYGGLELGKQVGLVPLGPDPASGFFEFWHVESGERPERDPATGRWRIEERTGLIFVLLPGGATWYGAQSTDATLPNHDPELARSWTVASVTLAPFLLSKYEMTQAQWLRVTARNPSRHAPGSTSCKAEHTLLHPADSITWRDATATLQGIGLELPTSAQWEYAMRAGSTTPYPTGATVASLQGVANFADRSFYDFGDIANPAAEAWDDGFPCSAPIGRFPPNAFGFFDIVGNAFESCRDFVVPFDDTAFAPEDGMRLWVRDAYPPSQRVVRGGGWNYEPEMARSCNRFEFSDLQPSHDCGVRPERRLDR